MRWRKYFLQLFFNGARCPKEVSRETTNLQGSHEYGPYKKIAKEDLKEASGRIEKANTNDLAR